MPPHHGNDADHKAPVSTHGGNDHPHAHGRHGAGAHSASHGHTMPGAPEPVADPKPGQGHFGQGYGQDPDKLDPRDRIVDREVVNATPHYSLHAVFKTVLPFPKDEQSQRSDVEQLLSALDATGVEIRGWYDVSGFRADADLLFWGLADSTDTLQAANQAILNSELGVNLERVWNVMSGHMVAEFSPYHLPACFDGVGPRDYAAVYPFNRSFDWYWLQAEKRQDMLKRHGMNGLNHLDVKISTLAAFAISDYEWSITLEHDDVARLMSVLRTQRAVEARVYTREDTPMFAGKRMELIDWVKRQPAEEY
ncbi:chlorite dismutase family protein [Stomatohabitans albus]|uniref:chlorite dismutase family protein n=1 Tax=Stomatohabitans albus TaxID=3110766 RepID=UPI00300C70B6